MFELISIWQQWVTSILLRKHADEYHNNLADYLLCTVSINLNLIQSENSNKNQQSPQYSFPIDASPMREDAVGASRTRTNRPISQSMNFALTRKQVHETHILRSVGKGLKKIGQFGLATVGLGICVGFLFICIPILFVWGGSWFYSLWYVFV